jgi:hypothetical protein
VKPTTAQWLEQATVTKRRAQAVQNLLADARVDRGLGRDLFMARVYQCLHEHDSLATGGATMDDKALGLATPQPTLYSLQQAQLHVPYIYSPPQTVGSVSGRGPWDGSREQLSVGKLAMGHSASAAAAGLPPASLRTTWSLGGYGSASNFVDADPMSVEWVHVLVARMAGRSLAPAAPTCSYDGGAVSLRVLLWAAAIRPWVLVFECSPGMVTMQEGNVWQLITGTLDTLGYTVTTTTVCPSR